MASRLRLTEDQVAALEEEDFGYLNGDTFVRGYLRNYARTLDLDPEAIITAYEQSGPAPAGGDEVPLVPPAEQPAVEHPWRLALGSLFIVLLIAGGTVALVTSGPLGTAQTESSSEAPEDDNASADSQKADSGPDGGSQTADSGAEAKSPGETEPDPQDSAADEGESPGEESAGDDRFTSERPEPVTQVGANGSANEDTGDSPSTAPPASEADPDEMRVRTWERSWMEVTDATGRVLLRQLVEKGKELYLYGRAPFAVKVGNAAGVQLYFEDDPLPPLGGIGEVVTRTVGPDSETIAEEEVGPPEVLLEARREGRPTTGEGPREAPPVSAPDTPADEGAASEEQAAQESAEGSPEGETETPPASEGPDAPATETGSGEEASPETGQ
jgi:cytoskeleton protein RodZ